MPQITTCISTNTTSYCKMKNLKIISVILKLVMFYIICIVYQMSMIRLYEKFIFFIINKDVSK